MLARLAASKCRRRTKGVVKAIDKSLPALAALRQIAEKQNNEDLAKLAERSRQAQRDFAAGRISDRDLLWIIVIALAIIVLAIALR